MFKQLQTEIFQEINIQPRQRINSDNLWDQNCSLNNTSQNSYKTQKRENTPNKKAQQTNKTQQNNKIQQNLTDKEFLKILQGGSFTRIPNKTGSFKIEFNKSEMQQLDRNNPLFEFLNNQD